MFPQVLSALSLAAVASAIATSVVPPGQRGPWYQPEASINLANTLTDSKTILSTAKLVNQKLGAEGLPDQPIAPTVETAVDGKVLAAGQRVTGTRNAPTSAVARRSDKVVKRTNPNYQQVFAGTGVLPSARDASIQGTGYLTYTTVNNATYNVDACLAFCDSVPACVFANIYYEYNNPGLIAGSSNLKCAIYSDTHTTAEKTNWGGQQQLPPPGGLTYIQQSSGWSKAPLVAPTTPEGYEYVFGPLNGANNAPGYMGFTFLDRYDVAACAAKCNTRGADGVGGACQYFNIWRAVVDGVPTTYTCSMYFIPADASTAVNGGQGNLLVTYSRGYRRKNLAIDGGFESFAGCDIFCYVDSYAHWIGTSAVGGTADASIFFYAPYAHSGNVVALLGSAEGYDNLAGTLTPAAPLQTVAGRRYSIGFFHSSSFSSPANEAPAFVEVRWNGAVVSTIRPGFSNWKFYQFTVTARGNDALSLRGGAAPAWSFIDDITVFQL